MKQYRIFLFIQIVFFSTLTLSAQKRINDSSVKSLDTCITTDKLLDSSSFLESNGNFKHTREIKLDYGNKSLLELIFPSIIALIVGFMAYIATIRSANYQRNVILKQMEDNKIAVKEQISSGIAIAELDFRKTVLSSNRQTWINDLRNIISELISLVHTSSLITINFQDNYSKIALLMVKAELMLNPEKDKELINSILKLEDSLIDINLGRKEYDAILVDIDKVKSSAKLTLKNEWERVKRGE